MKLVLLLVILLAVLPIALCRSIVRRVLLAVSVLVLGALCVHVLAVACIFTYSLVHERGSGGFAPVAVPATQGYR